MPRIEHFRLPDTGEGLVEAEIVRWRVAEGDPVAVNDVLLEIETAKAQVELPSPVAGRVMAILVGEGTSVAVGTPLVAVDTGSASDPAPESVSDPAPGPVTEPAPDQPQYQPQPRPPGPPTPTPTSVTATRYPEREGTGWPVPGRRRRPCSWGTGRGRRCPDAGGGSWPRKPGTG